MKPEKDLLRRQRIAELQVLLYRANGESTLKGYRGGYRSRQQRDEWVALWQSELDQLQAQEDKSNARKQRSNSNPSPSNGNETQGINPGDEYTGGRDEVASGPASRDRQSGYSIDSA